MRSHDSDLRARGKVRREYIELTGKHDMADFLGYPDNYDNDNDGEDDEDDEDGDGVRAVGSVLHLARRRVTYVSVQRLHFRPSHSFTPPPSHPSPSFVPASKAAISRPTSLLLPLADSPYSYSYPIYASRNCEIHYRITG